MSKTKNRIRLNRNPRNREIAQHSLPRILVVLVLQLLQRSLNFGLLLLPSRTHATDTSFTSLLYNTIKLNYIKFAIFNHRKYLKYPHLFSLFTKISTPHINFSFIFDFFFFFPGSTELLGYYCLRLQTHSLSLRYGFFSWVLIFGLVCLFNCKNLQGFYGHIQEGLRENRNN